MIVPMKKVYVVVQAKDRAEAVGSLGALGVVHVEHRRQPQGEDIRRLEDSLSLLTAALAVLERRRAGGRAERVEQKPLQDWRRVCQHLVEMDKRLDHLQEYRSALLNSVAEWQPWQDFDPALIERLAGQGVFVRLYQIPLDALGTIPAGAVVHEAFRKGAVAYCAVVSRSAAALPFREVALPKTGLSAMKERLALDERAAETIAKEIAAQLCHWQGLVREQSALQGRLEFCRAQAGMAEEGALAYLSGYIPADAQRLLVESAARARWAVIVREPADDDAVPTLIRNPRWVSVIEPVFKFIDIVPGYRELDISFLFLVFFSVFFGMLVGDAGIGAVFLGITVFAQMKTGARAEQRALFALFYLLSLCAIAWGVLSGTYFGQAWLPLQVRPLLPQLRNDAQVQALCFFIGALHLSIAHAWRAALKAPSMQALADIGWIAILWTAYLLAKVLVLGEQLAPAAKPLFITGSLLVILFSSPRRNIALGIGQGLASYLLNVINGFTDVISYIRLFAVGLATVAIADAFNAMARGFGFTSLAAGLLTATILLVGHGLNVLMGPMSVLVHGVRLNVLEFCNHIDVKWNGFTYHPLRQ